MKGDAGFLSHVSMTFKNVARARRLLTDATFPPGSALVLSRLYFLCFSLNIPPPPKSEAGLIFGWIFVTETYLP